MTFLQHTEVFVDTSNNTGHGGLTCTGRSVEHQVIRYLGRFQSLSLALLLQLHEVCQRADLLLHRTETNQFVKFLVGVAFKRLVHNDGVFLLRLLCLLHGLFRSIRLLFVIREDGHENK